MVDAKEKKRECYDEDEDGGERERMKQRGLDTGMMIKREDLKQGRYEPGRT